MNTTSTAYFKREKTSLNRQGSQYLHYSHSVHMIIIRQMILTYMYISGYNHLMIFKDIWLK